MPRAYLKRSAVDHFAREVAFHDHPAASESGIDPDDIAWFNRYNEMVAQLREVSQPIDAGAFPAGGPLLVKGGLLFFTQITDWYVDTTAAAIVAAPPQLIRGLVDGGK